MLLSDDEITERMESPLNLLNRLRTSLDKSPSPALPIPHDHSIQIPSLPPSASDLIPDLNDRISDVGTRSKAVKILNAAMDELQMRMPEIQKPERLAAIATEMSKVINQHDSKPREENTQGRIVVYAPQIQSISNYNIVEVNE